MNKTIITLILATLPGLVSADLADFGTTSEASESGGFRVTGVFQETPASTLGLEEGDIVTSIDGRKVHPTTSLARLVAGFCQADAEIQVAWTRDGAAMTGKTTLNSSLSDEEFEERYPVKPTPKELTDPIDELDVKLGGMLDQGGAQVFQLQLGGGGAAGGMAMSITQVTEGADGSRIKVSNGKEGSYAVHITSADGEVLFDKTIMEEELDKVPEAQRPDVKRLLETSANMGVQFEVHGNGGGGKGADVEKDASELLKDIEEEEK